MSCPCDILDDRLNDAVVPYIGNGTPRLTATLDVYAYEAVSAKLIDVVYVIA
jgi:hypothetical protein